MLNIFSHVSWLFVFFMAQMAKNLPMMQETRVQSLGQEDPPEKEMATHSSVLAWRSLWTEEPGWLQSTGRQRGGRTRATNTNTQIFGELSVHGLCWFFFLCWFLIGFLLLLLSFSSLHILHIKLLSDKWFANILSHSIGCLFPLLIPFLCRGF